MRAAVFNKGGEPWTIETLEDPVPGEGEAVIKVARNGICGTDVSFTSGNGYDFPESSVLGHEFAGEVVAIGKGVERLKLGDRVTSIPCSGCGHCAQCDLGHDTFCETSYPASYMGGYGEYMKIAERATVRLPQSLSMADGALVEPLAVGLHGVRLGGIGPGSRVLVLGAGSIGLATLFFATQSGARVVAASRSARRADMALRLGAEAFVETGDGEAERIADALGGPPDVVFECAGAVGLLQQSINLVRPKGTVVSMGFCMQPDPVIPGVSTFREPVLKFSMACTLDEFREVTTVLDAGHLEPRDMVTRVIGLDELPAMIEAMRTGVTETKVHVDPFMVTE